MGIVLTITVALAYSYSDVDLKYRSYSIIKSEGANHIRLFTIGHN